MDSQLPKSSIAEICQLLMKMVDIVAKREGIRCDTEYTPVAATPQKKVSIYLSEELLTHQLKELGIIGTEYLSILCVRSRLRVCGGRI